MEQWRSIAGFPNYEICEDGRLRYYGTEEEVELTHDGRGNLLVWLFEGRHKKALKRMDRLFEEVFPDLCK